MLISMKSQSELPVGLRQVVALHDAPNTVKLIMGVNGMTRVEMGQERLATGLQLQHLGAS